MEIAEVTEVQEPVGLVLYMLFSNFFGLLVVIQAYYFAWRDPRYRLFTLIYGTAILASVVVSFFYHLCQSASACVILDFHRWRLFDHITATNSVSVNVLLLAGRSVTAWIGPISFVYLGFTIFCVFAFPFDIRASVTVLVGGFVLVLVARLVVLRGAPFGRPIGKHRFVSQVSWPYLLLSLFFIAVGVLLYAVLDSDEDYPLTHPSWHSLIYVASWALFMGLMRDNKGWYSLIRLIHCAPGVGTLSWTDQEKTSSVPLSFLARSTLATPHPLFASESGDF